MSEKRYGLSAAQWGKIASLLPGKASDLGQTGGRILRSGAHWRDLPERYGQWKTVHRRFSRWCHAGVWERVFETLSADRDNTYLMLGSTIVRVRQQAASGKKRG